MDEQTQATQATPNAEEPASVHQGVPDAKGRRRSPWLWVGSAYFAEGIPYIIVMTLSVIMYKTMGISNKAIGFWTSALYLPWVVKPLWGPLVDLYWTKRNWIIWMQLLMGICFVAVALIMQLPSFFVISVLILYAIAFISATHDIACDGFYMLGLSEGQQAWFVGIRSTFYRLAMITGTGLLPIFAGYIQNRTGLEPLDLTVEAVRPGTAMESISAEDVSIEPEGGEVRIQVYPSPLQVPFGATREVYFTLSRPPEADQEIVITFGRSSGDKNISLKEGDRFVFTQENWNQPQKAIIGTDPKLRQPVTSVFQARAGNIPLSWAMVFVLCAVMFVLFFLWHGAVLPHPKTDRPGREMEHGKVPFIDIFILFFKKKRIVAMLAFLLLYRLAEAQLVKMAAPFLLDAQENGGLALTTGQVGFAYGTVGLLSLTVGGILGGIIAARDGLKKWIYWMWLAINVPDAVYIYLSTVLPDNFAIVCACVGIEQFGYGFGFTAYMLYMIFCAQGEHKTAHFAITTGFMALGMMLPGMVSGYIQTWVGYQWFFMWVMLATIPGLLTLFFIPLDPNFGKKDKKKAA